MKQPTSFKTGILISISTVVLALGVPLANLHSQSGYDILTTSVHADTSDDLFEVAGLNSTDKQNLETLNETFSDGVYDIQKMSSTELATFEKLVKASVEQLELPTIADQNDGIDEILGFFDSSSENYQNAANTTENLISDIDDNHTSPLDTITGEKVLAAKHGTISVGVLGSILNVAIASILGGVGGGVAMAIKQKGKSWVRNTLKSRLKATLVGAGIGGAAALLGKAVDFALDYSNPGGLIAKYFDSHDKIKNNGYLEFW